MSAVIAMLCMAVGLFTLTILTPLFPRLGLLIGMITLIVSSVTNLI